MQQLLSKVDLTDPLAGVDSRSRVGATELGLDLLGELQAHHGALVLLHLGSCTQGNELTCVSAAELPALDATFVLGEVEGVPVHVAQAFAYDWSKRQLVVDTVKGHAGMFSLECGTGRCFFARTRLFSAEDRAALGLASV